MSQQPGMSSLIIARSQHTYSKKYGKEYSFQVLDRTKCFSPSLYRPGTLAIKKLFSGLENHTKKVLPLRDPSPIGLF
jgi:hypothetical protein